MKIARAVQKLIDAFERLPGIGPKTAQRLTFYLLHVPQSELDDFASALSNLKKQTVICSLCFNVSETDPCHICTDPSREESKICVVEQPLDVLAVERAGTYKGLYHVLHGAIDPLNNIGPDELYIEPLIKRLKNGNISEVILATNPSMEGEATSMYIARLVRQIKTPAFAKPACRQGRAMASKQNLKITRIGRGLPTGADLEYADDMTLKRAFEGRMEY
jgi:recombination protein RecR